LQTEQELNKRNKKPNIPYSVRIGFGVLKNLTPRLKKKVFAYFEYRLFPHETCKAG
jgi:hypothetical protein